MAKDVSGSLQVPYDDKVIDFSKFERIRMIDVITQYTDIDITGMNDRHLQSVCHQLGIEIDDTMGKGKLIDAIFSEKCEPHLIQPTFIMDYPVEMSPLCKKHRDDPSLTERFELIVNGKELCNAYSELNDPIDQLERFKEQLRLSEKGDQEAMFIDYDFVRALEYGMPPASGLGVGIDRLAMIMTNQPSIQDVLFFPQMKPEKKEKIDPKEKYTEKGIPGEWVEPLQKLGYVTIEKLMKVEKPGKLHQEMMGYRKKNKLEISTVSLEDVASWIAAE